MLNDSIHVYVSLPMSSDGFHIDSGYQASPTELSSQEAPPGEPAANYLQLVDDASDTAAANQRTPDTYDYLQLVS